MEFVEISKRIDEIIDERNLGRIAWNMMHSNLRGILQKAIAFEVLLEHLMKLDSTCSDDTNEKKYPFLKALEQSESKSDILFKITDRVETLLGKSFGILLKETTNEEAV